jgi:hypothetical protein
VPAPFGLVSVNSNVSAADANPPNVRDRRIVIVLFHVVVAR